MQAVQRSGTFSLGVLLLRVEMMRINMAAKEQEKH